MLYRAARRPGLRRDWRMGPDATPASALRSGSPDFLEMFAGEMRRSILRPVAAPDPSRWPDTGLHAAWLGHSTVLVKADGFTFITDPLFSDRAGIALGPVTLGIKRLVAPALNRHQLPEVGLILVSHAHMDHLDLPSLRALESRRTTVVTAPATADLFRVGRYKAVQELRWGHTVRVGPATVQAIEVKHWGARVRTDRYRGYNGYLVEVGRYRIVFGGDTAVTDSFRRVHCSRPVHLAILPIGAYNPWIQHHCTPEQAWRMGNDAGAEFMMPVHHQTLPLGREPFLEPIERFYQAAGNSSNRIALRRIGQEFRLT